MSFLVLIVNRSTTASHRWRDCTSLPEVLPAWFCRNQRNQWGSPAECVVRQYVPADRWKSSLWTTSNGNNDIYLFIYLFIDNFSLKAHNTTRPAHYKIYPTARQCWLHEYLPYKQREPVALPATGTGGHVPWTSNSSFLVHLGVNLRANYPSIV